MTECEAWWIIGNAYATPRRERDKRQEDLTYYGICWAIQDLFGMWDITEDIYWKMADKIEAEIAGIENPYFYPTISQYDLLRASYCFLEYYNMGGKL